MFPSATPAGPAVTTTAPIVPPAVPTPPSTQVYPGSPGAPNCPTCDVTLIKTAMGHFCPRGHDLPASLTVKPDLTPTAVVATPSTVPQSPPQTPPPPVSNSNPGQFIPATTTGTPTGAVTNNHFQVAGDGEVVEATWGEETYGPQAFYMYRVGPFTAKTRVREGETHSAALARVMAELSQYASSERARKHAEFATEMARVPRQG